MKSLYALMGVTLLGAGSGLIATSHDKHMGEKEAKEMVQTKEKKQRMSEPKKLLKDMIHNTYIIEKDNKKYVGWFMRTNDGKLLVEKIEVHLKEKTPEEIQKHQELKSELREKFSSYLEKKGIEIKQK